MCGICGFIDPTTTYDREQVIRASAGQIAHRGPDDDGFHIDGDAHLGFRRLSIIDLEDGHQPLFNEDGTKVITFNGEIYNYRSLRDQLITRGHNFRTRSDTEVLLHAYDEYGDKMFDHIRGMFGFAVWDTRERELFLARDFFGIKPLYYAPLRDGIVWASEIKCILENPQVKRELNLQGLASYLSFQYNPLDETMFEGIHKLPPAHFLRWKDGKFQIKRYWSADFQPEIGRPFEDHVEELSAVLEDSVKAHMIADVEVGSFLSSGVDSSFVAASFGGQRTFTVGFANAGYSEIDAALALAKDIGVESHSKVITPTEYWDTLSDIQWHMDEPLADPACVPLYFVANLAREHVKVVLSGEGADELFGGYQIYNEPYGLRHLTGAPTPVRRGLGMLGDKMPRLHGHNYLRRGSLDLQDRFIGNAYHFRAPEVAALMNDELRNPLLPQDITGPRYALTVGQDEVTRMQHLDINLWMVGDILLKADKMSMANSLEVRVPFLDKEVMKVAAKIPAEYRVDGHQTKMAFRAAAKNKLPKEYYERPKLGFPVPIRVWLKQQPWNGRVRDTFTSPTARHFFNTKMLRQLLDDHSAGKVDNSRLIWTVYIFLVWHERYFG
ncbi:asparagine synthase (glutamine-hydrolysing) [Austwickia chelonae]|uniref:asparagine synthase (glutamine-hydrolyzing) n=1 Tax=Austwickia chelonae NBRC 105200 TaxID=1184607 RepID=K6V3J5_9MICO|nr:asparagine synthase (glutamine-hydrolyzing) [Austwickia chelonae]GAB76643.1 putative asparagine synthetase [Austwickia chelonae NBRC 105200]SEW28589.1 asparagine synthase (glutamine-hydrolysing) [Austwickia chelonae]